MSGPVDLVNARIVTDDVAGLAKSYAAVLDVDDVDAAYRRLCRLGVVWVMAPTDQPWGGRSAMFRDPDRNLVNLFTRHSQGDPHA